MVVATLTAILHKKGSSVIHIDKATYGFIASSFTNDDKKEMTKILKSGMAENIKECLGEELEKLYSKIECRISYRITEVDFIIGEKN